MVSNSPERSLDRSTMSYPAQPALDRIAKIDIFDESCEGHQALERIANKWTVLILYALTQGKKRYSELQRQISGVSPKMLIQNLRNLEKCGLVDRRVYPVVPPQVEYSLTPLGQSLVEPLAILGEWAYRHMHEVKAASVRYDRGADTTEPQ
jgi:DNA-binding HxlR family transcriptional regulator